MMKDKKLRQNITSAVQRADPEMKELGLGETYEGRKWEVTLIRDRTEDSQERLYGAYDTEEDELYRVNRYRMLGINSWFVESIDKPLWVGKSPTDTENIEKALEKMENGGEL